VCGFVFVLAKEENCLPDLATLDRMDHAIRHRGPDEHNQKIIGASMMGHRRLRIIDLDGGQQPMSDSHGKIWIVFNGEIYNYRDLRSELRSAGHEIHGESDTEVLLTAYLAWGDACVERLNGMFAFVIYDSERKRLFAARDRFGEKPLYVYETARIIYFASELKALLAGQVFTPSIDRAALYNYFTCNYIFGPRTVFEEVRRLQPGHQLVLEAGVTTESVYWQPPRPKPEITDEVKATREILDLLRDSVRLRLVSDVPIGFFLSGGLDSSATVAVASELTDQRLETFGIGFEEQLFDERPHQRFVAKRFGTNHHEVVLKPETLDVIEEVAWHLDEPFADSAALPTWFLSKMAREFVTVGLSGDGGDEMLAGYVTFRGHILTERIRRLPDFVRRAALRALRSLRTSDAGINARRQQIIRSLEDAVMPARRRFVAKKQTVFRRGFLQQISPYLESQCTEVHDEALFELLFDENLEVIDAITLWYQSVSLADVMLVKVDRMSMAHSLEIRAPFLDHRFAELANRIPMNIKMRGGNTKYLLKKAMESYFPKEFVWRPKQGFQVPLTYWFKGDLDKFARDRLLGPDATVPHIIDGDVIRRLLAEHESLAFDRSTAIWTLLMFEIWCRNCGLAPAIIEYASTGT
jgi:asparagine synthase (glutamine-hydrolysing)